MYRIEEFGLNEKKFIYIDFSGYKTSDEFSSLMEMTKPVIAKYPECSLYTITNIENVIFDSQTKKIASEYMRHNKPYVKYGVIIGMDGIKKMICRTIIKLSGRTNMHFAFTKEEAVEWLLRQR